MPTVYTITLNGDEQVSAGLRSVEGSAKAADVAMTGVGRAGAVAATGISNAASTARGLEREIVLAQEGLAQLRQKLIDVTQAQGAGSVAAGELRAEFQRQSAAIGGLIAEKRVYASEAKDQAVSDKAAATAARDAAAAEAELAAAAERETLARAAAIRATYEDTSAKVVNAEASELSARQTLLAASAAARLSGAAIPGARALGVLSGAFSVASLGAFAAIIAIGLLVGWIIKLFKASDDEVKVSGDAISASAARARAYLNEAEAAGKLTKANELSSIASRSTATLELAGRAVGFSDTTAESINKLEALKVKAEELRHGLELLHLDVNMNSTDFEAYRDALGKTYIEIDKQEKITKPQIEAYRLLAVELGWTSKQLTEFLIRNHAIPDSAVAVGLAVDKETNSMVAAANAAHSWAAELDGLRIARRNLNATTEGEIKTREQLNARIGEDIAAHKSTRDIYLANQQAIQDQVAAKQKEITVTEALTGASVKKKNAEVEAAHALQGTSDNATLFFNIHEKVVTSLQRGAEHHKSGAAAARAYSNELINLEKRAKDAEAALNSDNFAARDAKIKNDIEAERGHLKVNNQSRIAANAELTRIEAAQHAKVAQDRAIAEQQIQDEISRMQIAGVESNIEREYQGTKLRLEIWTREMYLKFGVTEKSEQLAAQMKKATEEEFDRWLLDQWNKTLRTLSTADEAFQKERVAREIAAQKAIAAATLAAPRAGIEQQKREMEEVLRLRQQLLSKVLPGKLSDDESFKINFDLAADIRTLQKLGFQVQDVDKYFGSASKSVKQFHDRVNTLANINDHPLESLKIVMQELSLEMQNNQTVAQRWAGVLENAVSQLGSNIEQGFEGLVNGTTTFAQLMKKIMFDLIASLAEQWGSYYLAIGIADLFWNPAKGAAELAAGAALLALAGVLHALGGSGASKATSTASSGASGGASAPTATPRAEPTPRIIPISQTPSKPFISFKPVLDKDATMQFWNGIYYGHMKDNNVLTEQNYGKSNVVKKAHVSYSKLG